VFDELFDSSIDANASEQILELLSEMSEEHKDCYYIITHNPSNVMIDGANIIELEKENGITRIIKT
jgi:ABC-type lipoprotein export system ATPase subunit